MRQHVTRASILAAVLFLCGSAPVDGGPLPEDQLPMVETITHALSGDGCSCSMVVVEEVNGREVRIRKPCPTSTPPTAVDAPSP